MMSVVEQDSWKEVDEESADVEVGLPRRPRSHI